MAQYWMSQSPVRVKLRQLPEPGSPKDDHLKRLFRNRADRITLVDVSGTRMPHDHWVFKQIRTGLMCAPRSTVASSAPESALAWVMNQVAKKKQATTNQTSPHARMHEPGKAQRGVHMPWQQQLATSRLLACSVPPELSGAVLYN